jgi:hypothetical protein
MAPLFLLKYQKDIFMLGSIYNVTVNKQETVDRLNIVEIEKETKIVTSWNPQPNEPVHDMSLYNNIL